MAEKIKSVGGMIKLDGEADYKKAVDSIGKTLTVLGSEMKKVSAEFANNSDKMSANAAKSEVYNKLITEQTNKISKIKEALANASREYGDNSKEVKEWQIKLNNAEATLANTENALNDLNGELNESEDKFDRAGKGALNFGDILKANLLSDVIMGGMRMLGNAIEDAVRGMVDFAKQGIEVASNLQEVQNVVDVTFGQSADEINKFAKSAAVSFGLSELSAKQFSGAMGAMLKSVGLTSDSVLEMSTELTGLSGDLASFYNLDVETAFNKLRSGISGEIEPLKQLGINLSVANLEAYAMGEGIKKAYKDMSEAEKVTLRYNYILKVTADAQGDFTRTSDSYANQQRILQLQMENLSASIGEKLLPSINGITTALNEMLSGEISAEEFGKKIGQTISELVGTITAQLPQFVAVGGEIVVSLIKGLSDTLPTIIGDIVTVANDIIMTFLSILPQTFEAGVQILISLLNGIAESLPEITPVIVATIVEIVKIIVDNLPMLLDAGLSIILALGTGIIESLPNLVEQLPQIIFAIVKFITEAIPQIAEVGVKLFTSLWSNMDEIEADMKVQLKDLIEQMKDEFKKEYPSFKELGAALIEQLILGMIPAIGWIQNIVDIVREAFGIEAPTGKVTSVTASGKQFGESDSKKTAQEIANELKDKYQKVDSSEEDKANVKDTTGAIKETTEAVKEISDKSTDNSALISDAITQANIDADDTTQEATKKLIDKIDENTRKAALVAEATAQTKLILERRQMGSYDSRTGIEVGAGEGMMVFEDGRSIFIPKNGKPVYNNASGTDFFPGGLTWVGEKGPELMRLPRGTQIFNNEKSQAMVGGDTINVIIDAKNVQEFNDIVRIAKNAKQSYRMGVV